MWSFTNTITTETPGGLAWEKMEETKHQYLPSVVIAEDFDAAWAEYMEAYKAAKPEDFFAEMQEAVYARIELVQGKNVRP
jgi:putative aldouronate transport system substrate-binding protein